MDFATIAVIVVLIITVAVLMNVVERKDLKCPKSTSPWDQCTDNYQAHRETEPLEGDDVNTLLDKIKKASSAEYESIKWRRSIAIAVISTIIGQLLMTMRCDFKGLYWKNIIIQVIVTFLVVYMFFDYYSVHVYDIPLRQNIPSAVEMLRKMNTGGSFL